MSERLEHSNVLWGDGNRQQKCVMPRVIATKCTELSDAAIDAPCGRISLRGYGVAAIMTEVKPIMRFALMLKKFDYNESSRLKQPQGVCKFSEYSDAILQRLQKIIKYNSERTVKFAGKHSCAGFGRNAGARSQESLSEAQTCLLGGRKLEEGNGGTAKVG